MREPQSLRRATLIIVESDPRTAESLVRIMATASGFEHTVCVPSADKVPEHAGAGRCVVVCDAASLLQLASKCSGELRHVYWMVSSLTNERELFTLAAKVPRLISVIGMSQRQAFPRLWELALPIRRVVVGDNAPLPVREYMQCHGTGCEWLPRSTADLHATLEDLENRIDQLCVQKRTTRRIVGVAHELLMNALYDAPVDDQGRHLYAHDRTRPVSVDARDSPRFVLATDGLTLVLQVSDRFGGLRRNHVYASIGRGLRSRDADATREELVNTGTGGAGVGIHRIVFQANATVFDVIPERATVVTALFELDQPNREARTSPRSLHVFSPGGELQDAG